MSNKDLKPGDWAAVCRRQGGGNPDIRRVTHRTQGGRITVDAGYSGHVWTFNPDGFERGAKGQFSRRWIRPATVEEILAVEEKTRRRAEAIEALRVEAIAAREFLRTEADWSALDDRSVVRMAGELRNAMLDAPAESARERVGGGV